MAGNEETRDRSEPLLQPLPDPSLARCHCVRSGSALPPPQLRASRHGAGDRRPGAALPALSRTGDVRPIRPESAAVVPLRHLRSSSLESLGRPLRPLRSSVKRAESASTEEASGKLHAARGPAGVLVVYMKGLEACWVAQHKVLSAGGPSTSIPGSGHNIPWIVLRRPARMERILLGAIFMQP